MRYNLLSIIGPTACGKTRLAVQVAASLDGEIISADSRQVYRELTIGTGKDLHEYQLLHRSIPYHGIDILSARETYDVFNFRDDFNRAFTDILNRNKIPVLCGGTGLYLSSVLENYQMHRVDFASPRALELYDKEIAELQDILLQLKPAQHNTTDLTDKERTIKAILIAEAEKEYKPEAAAPFAPVPAALVVCVAPPRQIVKERITARLKQRLESGLIGEVQELIDSGISFEKLEYFGLEYRYLGQYLKGVLSYSEMFETLNTSIHNFAKRQMTWFRRMEKHGVAINWQPEPDADAVIRMWQNTAEQN